MPSVDLLEAHREISMHEEKRLAEMEALMANPLIHEGLETSGEHLKANTNLQKQLEAIMADPALRVEAKAMHEKLASQWDVFEKQLNANPRLQEQIHNMMADPQLQHQAELVQKMVGGDGSSDSDALDGGDAGASLAEASSVSKLRDEVDDPVRLFGRDVEPLPVFDIGEEVTFYSKGSGTWIDGLVVKEQPGGQSYSVGWKEEDGTVVRKRVKARNIKRKADVGDIEPNSWSQWAPIRLPMEAGRWAKKHPGQALIYALMMTQNPIFKHIFGDPMSAMPQQTSSHVL